MEIASCEVGAEVQRSAVHRTALQRSAAQRMALSITAALQCISDAAHYTAHGSS